MNDRFLPLFLSALIGGAPLVVLAAVFGVVGWNKLRQQYHRAAMWLVCGAVGFILHALSGAFRVAKTVMLRDQLRSGQVDAETISQQLSLFGSVSTILITLSIACWGMAAISSRSALEPKGAA
jgi:hypothetical protein